VPPQYSAKKVEGERMYKKARRGDSVQLSPVDVEIFEILMTDFAPPEIAFSMTCSSGTYVRAVARDLGNRLGVGAHLTDLRRTAVGSFSVDRAISGNDLKAGARPDATHWIEPSAAVGHLTTVRVGEDAALRLCQGGTVSWPVDADLDYGGPIAVIGEAGLVGIAEIRDGCLVPKKILADVRTDD
jgi:tRNA pseudouridine55 synthase